MASKRQRGDSWEYTVKKAGLLDKPIYLTFASEKDGDAYVEKLEKLLDRGIAPEEYRSDTSVNTLADLVDRYLLRVAVKDKDRAVLQTVLRDRGATPLHFIDATWVDGWIEEMKLVKRNAPATIRAKIGAVARCCDWGMRSKLLLLPDHPFRSLRHGYAQYGDADKALTGGGREDAERDRRLEHGEHERILAVIEAGVLPRKQRPLLLEHKRALRCLLFLAQESAMRLREMYTLTADQLDFPRRTVFLDKTKNGSKRQVPLTTVALTELQQYLESPDGSGPGIFPWWDGSQNVKRLHQITDNLSSLWAIIFEAAGCEDLKFHDLRHEATSRLFERTSLSEFEIAKITGHKDLRMLARYANLRASNLATRLW